MWYFPNSDISLDECLSMQYMIVSIPHKMNIDSYFNIVKVMYKEAIKGSKVLLNRSQNYCGLEEMTHSIWNAKTKHDNFTLDKSCCCLCNLTTNKITEQYWIEKYVDCFLPEIFLNIVNLENCKIVCARKVIKLTFL